MFFWFSLNFKHFSYQDLHRSGTQQLTAGEVWTAATL